jgi:Peptidase_C39 like family
MAKRLKRLSRRLISFFIAASTVLATVTAASFSLLHPQVVNAQQVSRSDGYVSVNLPSTGNQDDNWSCGPNSAARVLAFYGHNVDYNAVRSAVNREFMLPPSVNVPAPTLTDPFRTRRVDIRTGTTPHVLRDVMRRWEGNNVRLERGASFSGLLDLVRDGKPVIALLRVGSIPPQTTLSGTWPELHWVAVHGFNESERMIYYTDTDGGRYQKSYDEFQSQWDWRVGTGFASEALHRNGVQAKTIIWVDRVVGGTTAALAQNPNNLQVQFREYNSTLNYDRAQGTCQVVTSRREVAQTLTCRQSWTQIAYAGRRILFYDRNARQIVIHVVNPPNGTIGSTLRTYGPAERVRGTWATITHIGNGVFRFTDDNGQFEDYTISPNDYSLVRVRR